MTIQMNAIEQYVPVVLFILLSQVVLTFDRLHEMLRYENLTESC